MSGGPKGPLCPPQELEVGGRRPPYLLVHHIYLVEIHQVTRLATKGKEELYTTAALHYSVHIITGQLTQKWYQKGVFLSSLYL